MIEAKIALIVVAVVFALLVSLPLVEPYQFSQGMIDQLVHDFTLPNNPHTLPTAEPPRK